MLFKLMDAFFGCIHANTSLPRTLKPLPDGPSEPRTCVVCLDCGKDLPYDVEQMRVIKAKRKAA